MKKNKFLACHKIVAAVLPALLLVTLVSLNACKKQDTAAPAVEKTMAASIAIITTDTLPVLLGKDTTLTVRLLPDSITNAVLLWKSSDSSVAKVSQQGTVHPLTTGIATISATTTDGSWRTAAIVVEVIDKITYMSGLTLTAPATSLYEGDTLAIKATINPSNTTYKTLQWSSSNETIAKVSSTGVVTGLSEGNVTVTVKAIDGSGVAKSMALEVKEVVLATSVDITSVVSETMAVGQILKLEYNVLPANATLGKLKWSSDNPNVVSVSSAGIITGLAGGSARITLKAEGVANVTDFIDVSVEEGKLNDVFTGTTTPWKTPTANATGIIQNDKFVVSMAPGAKYRGDFQRTGGAALHAGKFPIIAFKFNRPAGTGNIIFDTNNGSFLNGNNKLTTVTGKDGIQVHYADLSAGTFGASAIKLSAASVTNLTTFQLKIADFVLSATDIANGGYIYQVYWVKSFPSLAALNEYINR
ncbi:Ig-like domain-containing protein [Filimonas effusa]|nr:DUF4979 domain-containing protein [Filimonas effusa]